jgi:23S rRNA (cytosine1962-C5)-methyltransferase
MKIERKFAKVIVSEKGKRHVLDGHPWVYDNDIIKYEGKYENGDLVDVFNEKCTYLGTGFISEKSKIRVRIISNNANETFDDKFWERRIHYALDYRKIVMGEEDFKCCRLIFGEADQFPGLTIDRYNDILVAQVLSIGMEKIKDKIFKLIYEILKEESQDIKGIYERNDVAIRELEGLDQYKGWVKLEGVKEPESAITKIVENEIIYEVDVQNGQKTGFFLDQKYNRKAIWKIAKGKNVLDCFTHTGSFALNAAKAGAKHVHAVDVSESAIKMAMENTKINNLEDKMSFETIDVFDLLPNIKQNEYDFIILDPPAFTKSRKTTENAKRGYKEINYRAMKALPRGGYFATCSCSHFMANDEFVKMLKEAAKDAGVNLRQIEERRQSPDHPILWNVPETDYLKFYIFQII